MPKKLLIILIVIVVVLVVGGGYYYFYYLPYQKGKEATKAILEAIPESAVTNPLEKMPETNPFEKGVNPFKDLYQNPFK